MHGLPQPAAVLRLAEIRSLEELRTPDRTALTFNLFGLGG